MSDSLWIGGLKWSPPCGVVLQEGENREIYAPNHTGAGGDIEAIERWVELRGARSVHTRRSYWLHASRLLVWSWWFKHKGLSGLDLSDFQDYHAWLHAPTRHADWRDVSVLLAKPLLESSRVRSMAIVRALFSWLSDGGYLRGNPLSLAVFAGEKEHSSTGALAVETFLPSDVFAWLRRFAQQSIELAKPGTEAKRSAIRARFLLEWVYWCGARRGELPAAMMSSVRRSKGEWVWRLTGKGGKVVDFLLESYAMDALVEYRVSRGLPDFPARSEREVPLVARVRGRGGVCHEQIHQALLRLFRLAADAAESEAPEWAALMRQTTAHWLRHSYLTHLVDIGADIAFSADRGRHENMATTRRYYIHSSLKDQAERLRRLRGDQSV